MTCQPAVGIGIFLEMAFQAHAHAPVFMGQTVQFGDLSVTFLAGDFTVDVALMIEQDMLGHIVDFYPRCWRFGVKVAVLFLDPWMLGNNIVVTVQALFHRRYSGMIGVGHVRMTVLALNLFNTAVYIMTERDGLLRPDKGLRRGVKKDNKRRNKQSHAQGRQNGNCIFTQWCDTSLENAFFIQTDERSLSGLTISGKRFKK